MAGGGHNEAKFRAEIFAKSVSRDWDEAKAEWELTFVYIDINDRSCICDHSPIQQICVINNRDNAAVTEVGNVCVRKFLRLVSNKIFSVLRRVRDEPTKSMNPAALELFRKRGVISHSEEQDYLEYWRKWKRATNDQKVQKAEINARILAFHDAESERLIAHARSLGIRKV